MPELYNHMQYGWRHAIANVSIAKFCMLQYRCCVHKTQMKFSFDSWKRKMSTMKRARTKDRWTNKREKWRKLNKKKKEKPQRKSDLMKRKDWTKQYSEITLQIMKNLIAVFVYLTSSEYRKHRYLFTFVWAFFLTFFCAFKF